MSVSLQSPSFQDLSSFKSSLQERNLRLLPKSFNARFNFRPSFPLICASSSSLLTGLSAELDAVSSFSEIVPDTVIFMILGGFGKAGLVSTKEDAWLAYDTHGTIQKDWAYNHFSDLEIEATHNIEEDLELVLLTRWDQLNLALAIKPTCVELLATGLNGYVNQANRVKELFKKIWPPLNA